MSLQPLISAEGRGEGEITEHIRSEGHRETAEHIRPEGHGEIAKHPDDPNTPKITAKENLNPKDKGQRTGLERDVLPTLNEAAERVKQKKKKVDGAVKDIWSTMTFLVLSETGILTALYNIPDKAKCHYWWILLVLIIPSSVICTVRLSLCFRLLHKENIDRNEEDDVALWLSASSWRLLAFFACMVFTILINTAFLSAGTKLIPCAG